MATHARPAPEAGRGCSSASWPTMARVMKRDVGVGGVPVAGQTPVAQHGERVGDLEDLVETVRNEDHGRIPGDDCANGLEQPLASGFDSAEVGSSRTRTLPPEQSARAISTSCRWASGRSPTRLLRSMTAPRRLHSGLDRIAARARADIQRKAPRQDARENVLLDRAVGKQHQLLMHDDQAGRPRGRSEPSGTSLPATRSVPPSGRTAPDRMPIRVDLPAPLAPSRPCTSPAATVEETSSSA